MNKLTFSLPYLVLTTLFCVCLIIANLIEIKTVDLGWFTITAGVIVFPISYIINDCVVEVYGLKRAKVMIWLGFGAGLFVSLMLQLALVLPGGAEWTRQESMVDIYGAVPRIMFASYAAFLAGSMVNALVMNRMKIKDGNRRFSIRAIVSSLFGEGIDSVIFFPIAFGGIFSVDTIVSCIITQTLLKTVYEIFILPVTIGVVKKVKQIDPSADEVSLDLARIKYVWVDLDDTIWDFANNSHTSLATLFERHQLDRYFKNVDAFREIYYRHNHALWDVYNQGKITREFLQRERFMRPLLEVGVPDNEAQKMWNDLHVDYLDILGSHSKLIEGARELLDTLRARGYKIGVISNGFKGIQYNKLKSSGLDGWFDEIVLSDEIEVNKPDRRLFEYALKKAGATARESVIIGDNRMTDIHGGAQAGWQTIYFNRDGKSPQSDEANLTVTNLHDLIGLFNQNKR
ncbi:MAG: YjjG family noncanonical pyrimidine nucleotidase [Muribaculaceae bacterium]|nr:YjjG family noncanonical pyrimidine nucleotidase [Muribaculaceae bacterium]